MKTALITGLGQDSSYLSEFLLEKQYKVVVLYRRSSSPNFSRIAHIKDRLILEEGDVCDISSLSSLIWQYKPNEIYNLAAQSHVHTSFKQPFYTTEVDYIGCLNLLEICRSVKENMDWTDNLGNQLPEPKLYQAGTSEQYGQSLGTLYGSPMNGDLSKGNAHYQQDENTPMLPCSPYAIAKLAAHNAIRLYRESYGLFACSGILFNHDSPRRPEEFVTKKITNWLKNFIRWKKELEEVEAGGIDYDYNIPNGWISSIRQNKNHMPYGHKDSWIFGPKFEKLKLGNLDAFRDWGFAGDYIEGMWLMLQQDKPDDFVLATGETHTVREFLEEAFRLYDLNWQNFVEIDEKFKRPCEVPYLCGNASKAREKLGWVARTKFKDLVRMMVNGS